MLTPAFLAVATQSSALISCAVVPLPLESSHFTGRIVVLQFIPATPAPLLPIAPMIPATCVPCPPYTVSASIGSHVRARTLYPWVPAAQPPMPPGLDQMFAARSGWL